MIYFPEAFGNGDVVGTNIGFTVFLVCLQSEAAGVYYAEIRAEYRSVAVDYIRENLSHFIAEGIGFRAGISDGD